MKHGRSNARHAARRIAEARERWPGFAAYLEAREQGPREAASAKLRAFIDELKGAEHDERMAFVEWQLQDGVGPQPLRVEIVGPTLLEEERLHPAPEVLLQRMMVCGVSPEFSGAPDGYVAELRAALARFPDSAALRLALASSLLDAVEHAQHHLADGEYLGGAEHDAQHLAEVRATVESIEIPQWLADDIDEAEANLNAWLAFRAAVPDGFEAWCAETGVPPRDESDATVTAARRRAWAEYHEAHKDDFRDWCASQGIELGGE